MKNQKKKWKKYRLIVIIIIFVCFIGIIGFLFMNERNNNQLVTVTFIGENNEVLKTETIKKGSTIDQWDPEKTAGFLGWYIGEYEPFDFNTEIKENITLYAKWGEISKDMKFFIILLNEYEDYDYIEVKYNETIEPPAAPEKEGYTFVGWYENEELFDFTKPITKDHTLNAVYTKNQEAR